MTPTWRQRVQDLASPLAVAAYLAIAAVWFSSVGGLEARDPALGAPARLSVLVYLAAFVAVMWPGESGRRYWLCVALMVGSAFALLWLGPAGTSNILLVLLAAVLAAKLELGGLGLALLAINLALLAIIRWRWGLAWDSTWVNVVGIASFQAFAALVMRYASQAEQLAEALRLSNADLLATRSLLSETARDAERLRLSRELHDVAGHKLTALKLNLAALARDPRWAGEAQPALCARLADELLADIRGVVQQLRRDEGIDLRQALQALAAPFPRPRIHIEIAADARADGLEQAEALLRAVQEALTNAARHSQAEQLWVVLGRDGDTLQLDIRDDGRGAGPITAGHGLTGMRERFETAGGGLALARTATGGVQLRAWLPVSARGTP